MTNDELTLLQKGRIPAEVILPVVLERINLLDRDRQQGEPGALTLLCERQGIDYPALIKQIYRFENPETEGPCRSLDFNIADKLLCGVNLFDMWWGELEEYYKAVDLSWHKCECEGCETVFQIETDSMGRQKHQKYCSPQCSRAAYKMRKGRTQQRLNKTHRSKPGRPVGVVEKKCRKGHDYTPENTFVRRNGKRECLTCKREGNNRNYAERSARSRLAHAA